MAQKNRGIGWITGFAATLLYFYLTSLLRDLGSVEVFGISVPLWLIPTLTFLLGAVALWGYTKDQAK